MERQSRDFSLLRATLLKLYPGLVLPALAREHTRTLVQSGKAREYLLVKRGITFDYFLKYLVRHEVVGRLAVFRSFLCSQLKFAAVLENGRHVEGACALEEVIHRHVQGGEGWRAWSGLDWFVEEVLGVNLNFCVAGDKELVDSLEKICFSANVLAQNHKALAALKAALKKMERRQLVMSAWHTELSHLFSYLSITERTALEKANGFNRKQDIGGGRLSSFASAAHESESAAHFCGHDDVAAVFAQVADKASSQALSYDQARQDLKERVLFMLAFEILCCEGLAEQLLISKTHIANWQATYQRLEALRREAERDKAPREQRMKSVLQQIEEVESEERRLRRLATHWARAVLYVESRQVRESRAVRMSRLCKEFSKLQTSSGQLTKNIWSAQVEHATVLQPAEAPFGIAVAEPVETMQSGIPTGGQEDDIDIEELLRQKEEELRELRRRSLGRQNQPHFASAA